MKKMEPKNYVANGRTIMKINKMENNNTSQDKIVKRVNILATLFIVGVVLLFFIFTDPKYILNRQKDAYNDWRGKTEKLLSKKTIDFYNYLFYEHDFDKCSELVIPGRKDQLAKIFEVEDGYKNLDKDSIEFEIFYFDDCCNYKNYKYDRTAEIGVNVWLNNNDIESDEKWPITLDVTYLRKDNKWLIYSFDVLHFYEEDRTKKVCHKDVFYYEDL